MPPPSASDQSPSLPRRACIIGVSGAGKTTLARQVAAAVGASHVELDALHWEPNWTEATTEVFRHRVQSALNGDRWVVDGNYSKARDLLWARADTLIWLDYPLPLVMARMVLRTARRIRSGEELWNGNRESFRMALSRDSIILWALRTHGKHRRQFPELLSRPEYAHLTIHRMRSPRETEAWMRRVLSAACPGGGEGIG